MRPAGLGRATLKIAGTLAKAVAVQTLSLLLLVLIAVLFLGANVEHGDDSRAADEAVTADQAEQIVTGRLVERGQALRAEGETWHDGHRVQCVREATQWFRCGGSYVQHAPGAPPVTKWWSGHKYVCDLHACQTRE